MEAAVIGCGRMGAFTSDAVRRFAPPCWLPLAHAEAIKGASGLELTALCDPDGEQLARAARCYGVTRTYSDHRALLAEKTPDLVGIATRTWGRADIIEDCYAAGVRAFHIEKPICNSVAELDRLTAVFAHDDVFVTLGAVRRHFAIYREAIARATSGRFGEMVDARVDLGEGALFWTHPHSVDLILLAAGPREVARVQAQLGVVDRRPDAIVNDPIVLGATIWFDDGFAGHIGRAPGADFHLACQSGRFAVLNDGHTLWQAEIVGDDPYPRLAEVPFTEDGQPQGARGPILQLAACLRGDPAARWDNAQLKRDILRGQRVLFAMVQSHLAGGCPIGLDAVDPDLVVEGRTGTFHA